MSTARNTSRPAPSYLSASAPRRARALGAALSWLLLAACQPSAATQSTAPTGAAPAEAASNESTPTETAESRPTQPLPADLDERAEQNAPARVVDERSGAVFLLEQALDLPLDLPLDLAPDAERLGLTGPAPRNVVLLIGDGMGPVHETAASRWLHGEDGKLRMQQAPHRGQVATACADREITDSAAAATAMSTGVHVNYEVVAMAIPGEGGPLKTVLEQFIEAGKPTGMVTTTRLTHATPASYASHVPLRYSEAEIAPQILQTQPTVLFGGGGRGMSAAAASDAGYAVATNADELANLPDDAERWALIVGGTHLPYIADGRGDAPDLATMTTRALELLDTPQGPGFFLMVEAGRIDHASHNNNIARMLPELAEFDEALGAVLEWAEERDDTLIMLTADHECGGLSLEAHAPAGELPQVSWSTGGHTAADVHIYGWGPFGDRVARVRDNRDVYWLSRWPLGVEVSDLAGTSHEASSPEDNLP